VGTNAIPVKSIFKRKLNAESTVWKYKARLTRKHFMQREGVDFSETFARAAKLPFYKILVVIAGFCDFDLIQMDVIAAFLNLDIKEEIFVDFPEGPSVLKELQKNKNTKTALRLKKAFYGLKQAPRFWNKR